MTNPDLDLEFCCTCLKVCADDDKFVSLNSTPPEDISFKNKLKACVPEMGMANTEDCFLCKSCSVALETAYTFRCMCLRSESKIDDFRISLRKKAAIAAKNIKQEVIETICISDEVPPQPAEETIVALEVEPPACILPEPIEKDLCVESPTISIPPQEPFSFNLPVQETSVPARDSTIEIVKDELGSLLTESLGNSTIDINIHIFNENRSAGINSEINILNSLDAELEELKKHTYYKQDLPIEKKFDVSKSLVSPKEDVKSVDNSLQVKKILSDSEIIEMCCKTIPELSNCCPEALDCRVAVEKIVVDVVPVIIASPKNTTPSKKDTKGKAFWCHICHKDVHRRDRFNAHILKHSNIKGYKCDYCPERFFSSVSMNKHKRLCCTGSKRVTTAIVTPKRDVPKPKVIRKIATGRRNQTKKEKENIMRVIKTEVGVEAPRTPTTTIGKTRKSTRKVTPSKRLSNLNDAVYRCKQCTYQSYYKQKYQVHLLHHANNRPFGCAECSKKFYEKWELNRHMRINHGFIKEVTSGRGKSRNYSFTKPTPKTPVAASPTPNNSQEWEEDPFLRMIEPAISLTVHPGTVVTPIIQSIHSLASTPGGPAEMSFACKTCNISFKSRNLLILHTQAHQLKHKCKLCNQEFLSETDFAKHLEGHINNASANESVPAEEPSTEESPMLVPMKRKRKKFFCTVCNAEFSSRDHGNVHTGARPYTCKVCFKQFAAYTTLRKHKLTHGDLQQDVAAPSARKTGRQPVNPQRKLHGCEICKKKFVNKEHVFSHTCHTASGDAVYRCQICKNAFVGRAALIEHMGVHISQSTSE